MKRLLTTIGVLTGATLAAGCDEHGEAPPPTRPVLSIVVEQQTGEMESFAGSIEPRYQTNLAFRVLGRVIARDVNVGDVVTKGTRVAAIDPVALDLAVRASRAALATATARLANAASSEQRRRILFEKKDIPPEQFEVDQQTRQSAEAAVAQARSALDKALEQYSYAELRAEFDGVVTAAETEVGHTVAPGQTVIAIARPDIREAVIDAPDDICASLREGSPFQVSLQTDPARRVEGRVREIAPQVDVLTHSRRVRISLDAPPEDFRLGSTITAYLPAGERRQMRIPSSALLERDGKTFVWVVDQAAKTVSLREVSVISREAQSAVIANGLERGVRVVTAGVHSLTPGQSVKISEEGSL